MANEEHQSAFESLPMEICDQIAHQIKQQHQNDRKAYRKALFTLVRASRHMYRLFIATAYRGIALPIDRDKAPEPFQYAYRSLVVRNLIRRAHIPYLGCFDMPHPVDLTWDLIQEFLAKNPKAQEVWYSCSFLNDQPGLFRKWYRMASLQDLFLFMAFQAFPRLEHVGLDGFSPAPELNRFLKDAEFVQGLSVRSMTVRLLHSRNSAWYCTCPNLWKLPTLKQLFVELSPMHSELFGGIIDLFEPTARQCDFGLEEDELGIQDLTIHVADPLSYSSSLRPSPQPSIARLVHACRSLRRLCLQYYEMSELDREHLISAICKFSPTMGELHLIHGSSLRANDLPTTAPKAKFFFRSFYSLKTLIVDFTFFDANMPLNQQLPPYLEKLILYYNSDVETVRHASDLLVHDFDFPASLREFKILSGELIYKHPSLFEKIAYCRQRTFNLERSEATIGNVHVTMNETRISEPSNDLDRAWGGCDYCENYSERCK